MTDDANRPAPPSASTEAAIQIELDEATAQGIYCNLALLNHSDSEFVFDFVYIPPAAPRARVRARIITSPRHAKRLLRALEANLARYEERYGKIEELPAFDGRVVS